MADPLSNHGVATKNYVDTISFTTAGGVVSGIIKLNVGSVLVRSLRCNDLSAGKKFTLLLGTHKYANVFRTQFRITSAYQDKN